jgi:molybdopterin molybdotransferase
MERAVKGRGFEKLATVEAARARFLKLVPPGPLSVERVPLKEGLGRTLARRLEAPGDVPPFHRAAMDGFALRSKETFGATLTNPLPLRLAGSSDIGAAPRGGPAKGECFRIVTGAVLPRGTDAVLMFENAREHHQGLIEVELALTPWENVSKKGEDVRARETLLEAGARLEPQDIALAAAFGFQALAVARRPRIGVLSTGDELAKPGARLRPGQIHDANRPGTLAAAQECGAQPVDLGIAPDDLRQIKAAISNGLRSCDLVVISGGTSVGPKDFVPEAIRALAKPGLVVHGVGMRPGYPVALGAVGHVPVVLLPGSPVAAALNVDEFVVPAVVKLLGGRDAHLPRHATLRARAARRIAGAAGLRTYARVVVSEGPQGLIAEPIRISGSSILSSLVRATGIVIISPQKEGIEQGEEVEVRLLRAFGPPGTRSVSRRPVVAKERATQRSTR